MEEAEFLCDRIALVDKGTIAALGTPWELKAHLGCGKVIEIGVECTSALEEVLSQSLPEARVHSQGGLSVSTENPEVVLPRILKRFVSDPGYGGAKIVVREPLWKMSSWNSPVDPCCIKRLQKLKTAPAPAENAHFWQPLSNRRSIG